MQHHYTPRIYAFHKRRMILQDSSTGCFRAVTVTVDRSALAFTCDAKTKLCNKLWFGELFEFLISVSHNKGNTDHNNVSPFVKVLYEECKTQSMSDWYKCHLSFLIIVNWNTKKWWIDSLFVFLIGWHQTKKQRTAYTEDVEYVA